jgi:seryl-tRNA synthetase
MLEFLREKGEALKNFLDKDKEEKEEKSSVEKLIDFQEAKKAADIALSEEDKKNQTIDDTGETKKVEQILEEQSAKKEEESKEKDLNDKLADIEKVISTFGEQTDLGTPSDPFKDTKFELNKPINFQTKVAQNYIAPYLQQPTSQGDRIKLLFESLKKQNLI